MLLAELDSPLQSPTYSGTLPRRNVRVSVKAADALSVLPDTVGCDGAGLGSVLESFYGLRCLGKLERNEHHHITGIRKALPHESICRYMQVSTRYKKIGIHVPAD